MDRQITCECGFSARSRSEEELVQAAQAHAYRAHGLVISAELVVAMSKPAPGDPPGSGLHEQRRSGA